MPQITIFITSSVWGYFLLRSLAQHSSRILSTRCSVFPRHNSLLMWRKNQTHLKCVLSLKDGSTTVTGSASGSAHCSEGCDSLLGNKSYPCSDLNYYYGVTDWIGMACLHLACPGRARPDTQIANPRAAVYKTCKHHFFHHIVHTGTRSPRPLCTVARLPCQSVEVTNRKHLEGMRSWLGNGETQSQKWLKQCLSFSCFSPSSSLPCQF